MQLFLTAFSKIYPALGFLVGFLYEATPRQHIALTSAFLSIFVDFVTDFL